MELYTDRNPYADHLVEVNKHNPVETIADICNELGATIIPKGTALTEEVASKLARFNLLQPLELQVSLSQTLSPVSLHHHICDIQTQILSMHPDQNFDRALSEQCSGLGVFPLLNQKLTVFAERMPDSYHQTQGVAAFALLIATELGLNAESRQVVFVASQMHEAGLLNIPPELCAQRTALAEPEQRELDIEQLNRGKKFLDQVPNLSKRVGRAVLEHRERIDGSGWPRGLTGDRYSIETQTLALAVFLNEAMEKRLQPRGYDVPHLLPWVQTEYQSFDPEIYRAIVQVLKKNDQSLYGALPHQVLPDLARYLRILQYTMKHWLGLAADLVKDMQEANGSSHETLQRPAIILSGLESLCFNAGLWDEHIQTWLASIDIQSTHQEMNEVEMVALMFESMLVKFKRLNWAIHECSKTLGREWAVRSERLGMLLYRLPEDHFSALEYYGFSTKG